MTQRSFTLIELLVVVGIVATLASVVVVNLSRTRARARDQKRKTDLLTIQGALEIHFASNRSYPSTATRTDCGAPSVPAGVYWCGEGVAFGARGYSGQTAYVPNLAPNFMNVLPSDPGLGRASELARSSFSGCGDPHTGYVYASNGTDYKIVARCTIESSVPAGQFHDPALPNSAYALFSAGASSWRY